MIPLTGPALPHSPETLRAAMEGGLAAAHASVRRIQIEGGEFPKIERFELDLSGTRLSRAQDLSASTAAGPERGQIQANRVEWKADPLEFEGTPLRFELWADQAVLSVNDSKAGALILSPVRAARGEVHLSAQRSDLEALVHSLVAEAASQQGIQIKKTRLELESSGARSLSFRAEVTAKMFIMNATVGVSGRLAVDEQLNARLTELSCKGDGMIASAANALLKPHFQRLESQPLSLKAFAPGDLQLCDVRLETGDTVRLSGVFGS